MTTPFDQPPAWVADAVFYQIFPDRFARSGRVPQPSNLEPWDADPTPHGYKGGDLLGVVDHLDYLASLGINAIYFNPIFQSASNHRYHTHDYFKVDPLLGGNAAFEVMMGACHDRGIRVVLDGVFNHASRGFFQFNDLLENGQQSPWRDWFKIHDWPLKAYDESEPARFNAWWGLHALPQLNTDNPEVREFLMQVGEYWLAKGVDGWRLDVPEEIQTEGFWEEFRARTRAVNPESYIVGEIWKPAPDWVNEGSRFDGVMNYPFGEYVLRFVAGERINLTITDPASYDLSHPHDAGGYADSIDFLHRVYSRQATLGNLNLFGSHDTPRLLEAVGGDRDSVVLATVLQMTFPGAPSIYYGDEIGMRGAHDPGSRGGFPWDRRDSWDEDLLTIFTELIALRKQEEVLRTGEYRRLAPGEGEYETWLYVMERRLADDGVVVAVNAGDDESSTTFAYHQEDSTLIWGQGSIATTDGMTTVTVPARAAAIWNIRS